LKYDLTIDYWTDCVGTFDPLKVVGLAKRTFPGTVVDATDFEAAYLERFLALIEAIPEPGRATMTRQAKRKAMDNGPRFHFEIPTDAGKVQGHVGRYRVHLDAPDAIGDELRGRLVAFLSSLKLGEAELSVDG